MQSPAPTLRIPAKELSQWTAWQHERISRPAKHRTPDLVQKKYDEDVYHYCLERFHALDTQGISVNPLHIQHEERFRSQSDKEIAVSFGDELYRMQFSDALKLRNRFVVETLTPYLEDSDCIVELGCGFGLNLWLLHEQFPQKTYYGGEYSQNAVTLAAKLFEETKNITVKEFNFYDEQYSLIKSLPKNKKILLFTHHAVEQLPSAASVIKKIIDADCFEVCIHMEPVYELHTNSEIGTLRRKYGEAQDYNRDLLTVLQASDHVAVDHIKPNVFGVNPVNPTSVICWHQRD